MNYKEVNSWRQRSEMNSAREKNEYFYEYELAEDNKDAALRA